MVINGCLNGSKMVVNGSKMYISIYYTIGAILSLSTGFIGFLRLFYVGCLFTIGFGGGKELETFFAV